MCMVCSRNDPHLDAGAKVRELDMSTRINQHVVRFDVSVGIPHLVHLPGKQAKKSTNNVRACVRAC
jgi:hypothetical protein